MLALVYLGGITMMQDLLLAVSGQTSPVAIVFSTLADARLVNPRLRRTQETIDRRFHRQKYSSDQALAGFAAAVRSETGLDRLATALHDLVQQTVQPEHASLWLNVPRGTF